MLVKNVILISSTVLFLSCGTTQETTSDTKEVKVENSNERIAKNVNVEEFKKKIETTEGTILDVRTPGEWATGVIENATKINFYDADFKDQASKLDKNKPVYVYCKSGGRSGSAMEVLKEMGFSEIYNLSGGIGAWDAAGYPKVK